MEYILIILTLMNVFQLVYWSRQVHKLVDKVMSRNYAEYVQVTKPTLPTVFEKDDSSVEEQEILNELNGMVSR